MAASSGIVASLSAAGKCVAAAIASVASFNYQLVGSVLRAVGEVSRMVAAVSVTLLTACGDIVHYLLDVFAECGNVTYAFLRLVTKLVMLLYHVLSLGVCGVLYLGESVAAAIAVCLKPLLLLVGRVISNVASTWHHIKTSVAESAPEYMDSIAASVTRFTRHVNSSVHNGAKCVAATVGAIIGTAYDSMSKAVQDCWYHLTLWVTSFADITAHSIAHGALYIQRGLEYLARTFQRHVNVDCYMVLFLATALIIGLKIMLDYMHKRDLTLPLFGYRRPRRVNGRHRYPAMRATNLAIDSSDDETFEDENYFEDVEESSEDTAVTSEEEEFGDSDSVDEYEVASEDSDDSLDSEGGESVEIQLPAAGGYNLRARKKSPSPSRSAGGASPEMTDEEELNRKCVVCQDQVKTVLVLPCKHMCLCVDCAHTIASSRSRIRRVCPLCRGRIHTVMNVYL